MSRPTFTVTAAARATGKSRRTIARMLDAGELADAHRDDAGAWVIPADALIAAGLTLHAPSPPDPTPVPVSASPPTLADPVADLRAEVAEWRRRAEVAEAVAVERAAALDDVRSALALAQRMLLPGPDVATAVVMPSPADTSRVEPAPQRRRRWRRTPR